MLDGRGLSGGGLVGQLPLARPPGLAGDQGGDQADRGVEAEQQGRADPAERDEQQGGDERGEPGDHGGELVGHGGAGGAGVGVEQFGEPGALGAGQGVLADGVGDDEVAMISRTTPVLTSRNIGTANGTANAQANR